jgi:hypothetical protein
MKRLLLITVPITAVLLVTSLTTRVAADQIPQGWKAHNMQPVGYSDMEGRPPFKLAIKRVGDKWYLYTGHLWHDGWSIVDVTDPANPKYVKFIPGMPNSWNIQVTLHDNLMIGALQPKVAAWGGDPSKPGSEGIIIWDISDPLNPKEVSRWKSGAGGTHRNSYPGGRYAYLSSGYPGYQGGNILVILDVSDPRNPKEVGKWAQPGMNKAAGETLRANTPYGFHGPAIVSPDGKTLVTAFSPGLVALDISDPANPKEISRLDFSPPFINAGSQSLHSALPLWDRNLVFVASEASNERCNEGLNFAGLVDIKDIRRPRLMSLFPLPQPPQGEPYKNFCEKGGRFGPHNVNHEVHLPDVEKPGNLIYLTYFNAGLRVFDIRDPISPQETGWFIPPPPLKRYGPQPPNDLVQQSEDVLVDTRGYIYLDDKHWGLFILKYSGPDQPAPTAR